MGKLNKSDEFDKTNTIAVIKRVKDSKLTRGAVTLLNSLKQATTLPYSRYVRKQNNDVLKSAS
jgi:hypothetical protein